MEHLSNDQEDYPNQHENSNKQCDETGHLIVNLMESQWKLRQKHRLWHMRYATTRACLYTHLKHLRGAKKSMPCLIQKASRCAADCTSKTTTLFIFHFLYNTKILRENLVFIYFIGSVVKIVLYFYFFYRKNDRL